MKKTYDTILLAHGSGGELTNTLLEEEIVKLLDNDFLKKRHDGALLNLTGKVAFSTDSYVVSPLFFPGGNIGKLALNGTVNDLAMCGALAKYISLSFIIEEGLSAKEFTSIIASLKETADEANVLIVTGDTKVVQKGKGDKLFVNTSGIGLVHENAFIDIANINPGDKIIISGPIAAHGMSIMSQRKGLEFESPIKSDTQLLHKAVEALLTEFGKDIHFLRDPTRGGVATTLNELSRQSGLGFSINETAFYVSSEVEAACEIFGIDPLYVANEGVFIAVVSENVGNKVIEKLHQLNFVNASIIGSIVTEHLGKVVMKSKIGGRRVLSMPSGELLPRIC